MLQTVYSCPYNIELRHITLINTYIYIYSVTLAADKRNAAFTPAMLSNISLLVVVLGCKCVPSLTYFLMYE